MNKKIIRTFAILLVIALLSSLALSIPASAASGILCNKSGTFKDGSIQYKVGNYYIDVGTDYKTKRLDPQLLRHKEGWGQRGIPLRRSTRTQEVYYNSNGTLWQGTIYNNEIVACIVDIKGNIEKRTWNGTTYVNIYYYNATEKKVVSGWTDTAKFSTNLNGGYWYF